MLIALEKLQHLLSEEESQHLEFKRARNNFDQEKLVHYSAALANERGGTLILGVDDQPRPRRVVGCETFKDLTSIRNRLTDVLHLRVEVEEVRHPDGRVLVFHVPSRPLGMPIQHNGVFWMQRREPRRDDAGSAEADTR